MDDKTGRLKIREEDVSDLTPAVYHAGVYGRVKRALDVLISLLLLMLFLLPLAILLGLAALSNRGSAVFVQQRVGRGGTLFSLYKIRTMRVEIRPDGTAQSSVTGVGRLLRRSSLDELLQLVNVLKGDMSLIGPRPLIPAEEDIHRMRMRFGVYALRPGMTGLAQIHGRDRLNASEKLHWDVVYLHSVSWKTDVQIFLKTVSKVLRCEDVRETKPCAPTNPKTYKGGNSL